MIDIGWELEARRDDRERAIRERNAWDNETIVFDGRPERRRIVILRLRAMVSTFEDDGYDWRPVTAAIHDACNMGAGMSLAMPEKIPVMKGVRA